MENISMEEQSTMLEPCKSEEGLYPGKDGFQDDIVKDWLRKWNRKPSRILKHCFPWLIFGMLCLVIGGIAGYSLRASLNLRFEHDSDESQEVKLHNQVKAEQLVADNSHSGIDNAHGPEAHRLVDNSHMTELRQEEEEVVDAVIREILENISVVHGLSAANLKPGFKPTKHPSQKVYLSVGMRNDFRLQACREGKMKQSFPDVDYALFGYDVMKGFPLAVGHDPGFTLPIFKADYSTGKESADCRYSIPKGLVIVPDVSCVTSYSSEIVKTQKEFTDSLSTSVGVQGKGFGVDVSVNVDYRKMQSEMENQEKIYILSSARCNYYFSKLLTNNAPDFNQEFLQWARQLEGKVDGNTYMEFLESYGTHFPIETTFGARYTYEHSMTTSEFEKREKEGVNVAVAASLRSFALSVGGHFQMDREEHKMAKDFSNNVTTKTVTVGATPPADGDAMKWASAVQLNPIPVYYKLSPIENLFTNKYMGNLRINYSSIHDNLVKYKHRYHDYLNQKVLLQECSGDGKIRGFFTLKHTRLLHWTDIKYGSLSYCLDICYKNTSCKAISRSEKENKCKFYTKHGFNQHLVGGSAPDWKSYLLWKSRIIHMKHTRIEGTPLFSESNTTDVNLLECKQHCLKTLSCSALSHANGTCKMYRKDAITKVLHVPDTDTIIVNKCAKADVVLGQ